MRLQVHKEARGTKVKEIIETEIVGLNRQIMEDLETVEIDIEILQSLVVATTTITTTDSAMEYAFVMITGQVVHHHLVVQETATGIEVQIYTMGDEEAGRDHHTVTIVDV